MWLKYRPTCLFFPDLVTGSGSANTVSTARGLSATQREACMRSLTTQKPIRLPRVEMIRNRNISVYKPLIHIKISGIFIFSSAILMRLIPENQFWSWVVVVTACLSASQLSCHWRLWWLSDWHPSRSPDYWQLCCLLNSLIQQIALKPLSCILLQPFVRENPCWWIPLWSILMSCHIMQSSCSKLISKHINGLVQNCSNSSALARELLQSSIQ